MITNPSAEKLYDKVDSLYTLIVLASKRARHINLGGDLLLDEYEGEKPVSKSMEEIAAGKIKYKKNKKDSIK